MAFCHQCGLEVAEIDIFCPHCGISLEPVSLPGPEIDDPYANTIAIDKSELAVPDETAPDGPGSEAAESAAEEAGGQEAAPASEPFDDIPTPIFIEQAGAVLKERLDEPRASAVEEYPAVEPPLESGTPIDTVSTETDAGDEEIGPQSLAGEQAEAESENLSSAENEASTETVEQPIDEECAEEIGEVVLAPEGDAEIAEDTPAAVDTQESDDAKKFAKSSGDLYSEITPFADSMISMPLEALESPEEAGAGPSSSVYDSVRIMDSDPKDTPASPDAEAPSVDDTKAEPSVETASDELGKNAQSYTTPNFGTTDTDGRKSTKLKPLDEGTVLNGRYEIIRKIGGGGMGAVYLASDNNLGGVLRAVKEMVQAHIEEEQQDKAINDFKRESMILSTLDHPSIPTIYDYFFDETECRFYLVMKYISGGDLASRIRSAPEGRIDEATVTEWAIQIADVLDYLHNRPSTIVYRDLKPSNVMLDGNTGRVMLIDFGIARSINKVEEKGVTAVGTMGYAPPELFSGNVEPRSDIYSLGSTMFHLMTGADPQNNPLLIFDFQKNPRPRQINPQLSDQIERILMHSVEYNAQTRFNSAGEMRQVLEEHLDNLRNGRVTHGIKEIPASVGLANQPVFCGFCGQKIVATDMFCAFCGAKQPLAQQGVHAEIYARSAPTARLVVIGTNELDTPAFTLEKNESLVGRRDPMSNIFPEVDLSKYDPQTKISRRHAKIWREGNSYMVEDLGSSNGTILLPVINDSMRLAPHQPHALTNGDKIRLGDTTLHFVIG